MSFVTTDQPAYSTGKTSHDNSSRNVQPTSSNLHQHRVELGPQRRRVNPESLAARLGPELVAEMEKHIIPGSIEMPPFSVRRDIQIKFGIDRRHIYDFFHSRGLRCLNEKALRNSYLEVCYQFTFPFSLCFLMDDRQNPKEAPEVSPPHRPFRNPGSAELLLQHWRPRH
jgi:hypothetical protein